MLPVFWDTRRGTLRHFLLSIFQGETYQSIKEHGYRLGFRVTHLLLRCGRFLKFESPANWSAEGWAAMSCGWNMFEI